MRSTPPNIHRNLVCADSPTKYTPQFAVSKPAPQHTTKYTPQFAACGLPREIYIPICCVRTLPRNIHPHLLYFAQIRQPRLVCVASSTWQASPCGSIARAGECPDRRPNIDILRLNRVSSNSRVCNQKKRSGHGALCQMV